MCSKPVPDARRSCSAKGPTPKHKLNHLFRPDFPFEKCPLTLPACSRAQQAFLFAVYQSPPPLCPYVPEFGSKGCSLRYSGPRLKNTFIVFYEDHLENLTLNQMSSPTTKVFVFFLSFFVIIGGIFWNQQVPKRKKMKWTFVLLFFECP